MICYIFVKECNDLSISDVKKRVHHSVYQELINHSDVEVVDQIPDNPEDNDEDETGDDDEQEKLSDSGDIQQDSDEDVDYDHDSISLGDQDELMLKTNLDTILLNDNIINFGGCSGKNPTKKSIYEDYPTLPTEVIPINSPFQQKTSFVVLR